MAAQGKEAGGPSFAEQQLLRHGWERGKGLGKAEDGICEPVKVRVKCDKGGVGHKQSEQFTFHWWDHVFNKASSCLDVETGQEGVVVKKKEGEEEKEEEGMISNKKPRKAMLNKSGLYGCFVKSATLFSGQDQPEGILSTSEDSCSSDEDDKLDLSSTTKLSDDALMRACGGRTAHKGARHGLKMSAKLARLEQQEQEFLAKYGKKEQANKTSSNSGESPNTTEPRAEVDQEPVVNTRHKKPKKKKKRRSSDELSENPAQEDTADIDPPQTHHNEEKSIKKCSKENSSGAPDASVDSEVVNTEKKKRKRKQEEEDGNGSNVLKENSTQSIQQCEEAVAAEVDEAAAHPLMGDDICKKEKRKKKKHSKEKIVLEDGPNKSRAVSIKDSTDAKESHGQKLQEEGSVVLQPVCDGSPKKKKKKLSKHNGEESLSAELESHNLEPNSEDLSTMKKKHKKKNKHK